MRRTSLAALAIIVSVGAGIAADDPIKARQALMKANGESPRRVVAIMKGARRSIWRRCRRRSTTISRPRRRRPALFPPGSDKGKTEALPAIWKNKSDFEARFAKLGTDSKAALAAIKDEATFKANFPPVFKNCGSCHELYRAKEK